MEVTQTRQEELVSIFWDMYKDAHGFRPRHMWEALQTMTEAEIEADLDRLQITITDNSRLREIQEKAAAERLELRVHGLIEIGAEDRATALRWIHEAEGSNGDNEYLCYLLGVCYHYFDKVPE